MASAELPRRGPGLRPGPAADLWPGGAELLDRALAYALASLLLVTPESLSNRTPCTRWDLRALLLHLTDSLAALDEAASQGRVGLPSAVQTAPAAGADTAAALVAGLRDRACRLLSSWSRPRAGPPVAVADLALPRGVVAATGAVEIAVHGWDVARACGERRPLPPTLAGDLLELCRLLVRDEDRPVRFAPAVDDTGLVGPGDRLLAFTGRNPR